MIRRSNNIFKEIPQKTIDLSSYSHYNVRTISFKRIIMY